MESQAENIEEIEYDEPIIYLILLKQQGQVKYILIQYLKEKKWNLLCYFVQLFWNLWKHNCKYGLWAAAVYKWKFIRKLTKKNGSSLPLIDQNFYQENEHTGVKDCHQWYD